MPNYLYILVRTDMVSLGRGKSVAQGAHAANAFTNDHIMKPALTGGSIDPAVLAWTTEADGFGTTIALGATLPQLEKAIKLSTLLGFKARIVKDPEYPLMDGATFHILPNVITTGYIFGDKDELALVLRELDLLKNDPV